MNIAILRGRLGKDPEIKYSQNGTAVCRFSMATEETRTNRDSGEKTKTTTWHQVVAFKRRAEVIKEYCSKGSNVLIKGKIDNGSYDDKDGNRRYYSQVIVDELEFLDAKGESKSQAQGPQNDNVDDEEDLPF